MKVSAALALCLWFMLTSKLLMGACLRFRGDLIRQLWSSLPLSLPEAQLLSSHFPAFQVPLYPPALESKLATELPI